MSPLHVTYLLLLLFTDSAWGNLPPELLSNMDNLPLSEATPPGTVVFTLKAHDPEGGPVRFGLFGAPQLAADATTGEVRLIAALDREVNDTLRATVTVEDSSASDGNNNVIRVPVTIIVLDENDSPPIFIDAPYAAEIGEGAGVGAVVVSGIRAEDPDLLGETLEISCEEIPQFSGACSQFEVAVENVSARLLTASLLLREPLDYAKRQLHQMRLVVSDGVHNTSAAVEVRVRDEQNTPPLFEGSLAGVVDEDAEIGTLVLTVHARDGDTGRPRRVVYELKTNPDDYFLLDPESGELRTARPLDKEALPDSTGVINLTIRAREVGEEGHEEEDGRSSSTAQATVTVRDVNDEAPKFDRRDYHVTLPENTPPGSPLPGLDMRVVDPDVGSNSAFSLSLQDVSGAFGVEPGAAVGSTSVTVRVANTSLDYEDPNQRKFILLVVARETQTEKRLSSTATVTVTVEDANDNAPLFSQDAYEARVPEASGPGTLVVAVTASDRDSGTFGDNGLVYTLLGDGAERFSVDPRTGVITVAECEGGTPGQPPCLDFETRPVFFLSYKATDDEGRGQSAVVPLKIALIDSNDNTPRFLQPSYRATIDEGATAFEPPLFVQAEDADQTSVLTYSLVAGDPQKRFTLDSVTGELKLAEGGVGLGGGELVVLSVQASDGLHAAAAEITISVRDVNNNAPVFEKESYTASVPEDAPLESLVEQVRASDGDAGDNARLTYLVQKGAFEHFTVEPESGVVRVSARLDFDRRPQYLIEILAVDAGTPALTGTTTLSVSVLNSNDKPPTFTPPTQRAQISEDAAPGTVVHTLVAHDPDVTGPEALQFVLNAEGISAVDAAGKLVSQSDAVKGWFTVDRSSGAVSVARPLSRAIAAVVRLPVTVTDISASTPQHGNGTLVVTLVGVNGRAPEFASPWRAEDPRITVQLTEEVPPGSLVGSFEATDPDSASVARYEIDPPSEYFTINNETGVVRTTRRVDFEETPVLNLTVVAWDSGEPPLSASAFITVRLVNLNDEDPVFSQARYDASVKENAPRGTLVTKVHAADNDTGEFGRISYSLVGEHAADFSVDSDGSIRVHNPGALDRESTPELVVQTVASDGAKPPHQRSVAVPVHIKIEDENEHAPRFAQRSWRASLVEDVAPGSPLLQLRAEDADPTSNLSFAIESGDPEGVFRVDRLTGVVYANSSLRGAARDFMLGVTVNDGLHSDRAELKLAVLAVNQHPPTFILPALPNATVEVPENAGLPNYLVMTVRATDADSGDNGRVSYHLKTRSGVLAQETDEFAIDPETGELRTKVILDRERQPKYELVLVARDRGSPVAYETLRFLTVVLVDANDNEPRFPTSGPGQVPTFRFRVPENGAPDMLVGVVKAEDQDEGAHARVFYVLLSNGAGRFAVGRTDGRVRALASLDREQQEMYQLIVKATNDPDYSAAKAERELVLGGEEALLLRSDASVARVIINVADENDNAPTFEQREYYAGVSAQAGEGEPVAVVSAVDPDKTNNGSLEYVLRASNLFPPGATVSSGSLVPSPFRVGPGGRLVTAAPMAEHDQGRFQLKLIARESAPPFREAEATVHVWVYAPGQLVRVIVSRPPERVHAERAEVAAELAGVTGGLVVLDDLRYHVDDRGRLRHDWSDMYLHVVDRASLSILPVPHVLRLVDANYDTLRDYYAGFAIQNVVPALASTTGEEDERVDPALAALVALLVVLGVGLVSFLVVCCCLRHWVMPLPGSNTNELKRKEALIKQEMADELACTTENPLWIEQKLKLYEEQELTMQVFSEPDQVAAMDDSSDPPLLDFHSQADAQSNMYATLQPPPRHSGSRLGHSPGESSDYATLSRPSAGYAEVPEVREVMAGFHGSTFQPPRNTFDPDM